MVATIIREVCGPNLSGRFAVQIRAEFIFLRMTILPIVLILIGFFAISLRWLYVVYLTQAWEEACVVYMVECKEPININEYMETWPIWLMVGYFWVLDYRTFIVNQDKMSKLLDFFQEKSRMAGK